jgi:hypothetical protein
MGFIQYSQGCIFIKYKKFLITLPLDLNLDMNKQKFSLSLSENTMIAAVVF